MTLTCPYTECNVTWVKPLNARYDVRETNCNQLTITYVRHFHFGKYTCTRRTWLRRCNTYRTFTFLLEQVTPTTFPVAVVTNRPTLPGNYPAHSLSPPAPLPPLQTATGYPTPRARANPVNDHTVQGCTNDVNGLPRDNGLCGF